jgi:hypothetical protein
MNFSLTLQKRQLGCGLVELNKVPISAVFGQGVQRLALRFSAFCETPNPTQRVVAHEFIRGLKNEVGEQFAMPAVFDVETACLDDFTLEF